MQKYSYWLRQADKKMLVVEAATREAREYLKAIAAELERKNRVAEEAAVDVNKNVDEDGEDGDLLGEAPKSAVKAKPDPQQQQQQSEGGGTTDGGGGGRGGGTSATGAASEGSRPATTGGGSSSRPGTSGTAFSTSTTTDTRTSTRA